MPRKKVIREGYVIKYIPAGRLNDLKRIAGEFPFIKDKNIVLWKYIELLDFIATVSKGKNLVGISQRHFKKKLKLDTSGISRILKDLINHGFLERDKSNYIPKEQSYEYLPLFKDVQMFKIENKDLNKTSFEMLIKKKKEEGKFKEYLKILNQISISPEILLDEYLLPFSKVFLKYGNIKNTILIQDYSISHLHYYPNNYFTSTTYDISYTLSILSILSPFHYGNSFVPKLPIEWIGVYKILIKDFYLHYPAPFTRIYSNLSNLKKCFKPYLRLNGKPMYGFDVANSQPLIVAAVFKRFSEQEYGCEKEDVKEYIKNAETGNFYEFFMELNNIKKEKRGEFKAQFFGRVFYPKIYPSDGKWLLQFKEKYPTCFECMKSIKGTKLKSNDYKKFPALMTEIESNFFINTNLKLIEKGYNVLNIHDSLYCDTKEGIELAKEIIKEKFGELGLTPKLKECNMGVDKKLI